MVNMTVFKGEKPGEVRTRIDAIVEENFPPPVPLENQAHQKRRWPQGIIRHFGLTRHKTNEEMNQVEARIL
jgi:hypothetical protein